MALNNATNLSENFLKSGLKQEFPKRNDLANLFPFVPIDGDSLDFATTGTFLGGTGEGEVLDPGDVVTDLTVSPLAINRSSPLGTLATRYQVEFRDQDRLRYPNNLELTQKPLARQLLVNLFFTKIGTTNSPSSGNGEFYGLPELIDSDMEVGAGAPTSFSFANFYSALSLVRSIYSDGPNAIVSNATVFSEFFTNCMLQGFQPQFATQEWNGERVRTKQGVRHGVGGVPWYVVDFLPDTSQIWFLVLGEEGLHGFYPAQNGTAMFQERRVPTGSQYDDVILTWAVGLATASLGSIASYTYSNL